MCAAGNIHYELNTVARDISFKVSRNPDCASTGGTDLPEFNSRTMNLCMVRNRTMLSGFPAGRDRAGGLPPQRVSCHDGNAAPPRMLAQLVGSRCHAMPSRVTAKSISRAFRNSANIKICRACFMPRYLFRWQFSAASADQHQNCTTPLTGALDPFCCQAMERLAPYLALFRI